MHRFFLLIHGAAFLSASSILFVPGVALASRFDIPSTVSFDAASKLRAYYVQQSKTAKGSAAKPQSEAQAKKRRDETGAAVAKHDKPELDRLGVTTSDDNLGGVGVVRIRPKGFVPGKPLLLYLHGGGFTTFSARTWLLAPAQLADASGFEVISIDYTTAPQGTWRIVTAQVINVYRAAIASGRSAEVIGIFGDSAGGSIVAGAVLRMRDEGLALPGALLLMSPWSDVSDTGDTYATLKDADPILDSKTLRQGADAYAAAPEQKNPYVSPVYGDYSKGFPPTLIQGGTREIFVSNFVRQYQAIKAGGGEAVLDLYEGMPHVFQVVVSGAPEQLTASGRAASFFRHHLLIKASGS